MDIKDVLNHLETIKDVHKNIILTNNFSKISNSQISWHNYKPGIYKSLYSKEYEYLVRNRQYSFLLKDNMGFVQFYYEYKQNALDKLKMAYYPYPVKLNDTGADIENHISDVYDETLIEYYYDVWEVFNHQFELNINNKELKDIFEKSGQFGNNESIENLLLAKFDLKYEHTNSSHLRIDYDASVNSHNKCELQIGSVNELRLPLKQMISPFIFFDFILKNIYRKAEYLTEIKSKDSYQAKYAFHKSLSKSIEEFDERV